MTKEQYTELASKNKYRESLNYISSDEPALMDFLKYDILDLDLKLHLTRVIICRHFPSTGGVYFPFDVIWFIEGFLKEYQSDLIKPWLSPAIKGSLEMIVSDDTFNKGILGTTFMFGVLEFYAKYRLGYRPEKHDFFDNQYHKPFRNMFLGYAINRLKKGTTKLGQDLNFIDSFKVDALKKTGIREKGYIKARIADRLSLARNSMIHGETHNFYDTGLYLAVLFMLFHFHGVNDGFRYEGI